MAGKREKIVDKVQKAVKHSKLPHVQEVVQAIIEQWGGVRKLAMAFYQEYTSAKPGSMTRARMLDGLLKLLEMTGTNSKEVDEYLTDADLDKAASELVSPLIEEESDATHD